MKIRDMFAIDKIIGLGIGCAPVILLFLWPFAGIHPCAWDDLAVSAGVLPKAALLPSAGTYLAHLLFAVFPYDTALFLAGLFAKLLVGVCGALAYGVFARLTEVVAAAGARDLRRRRIASRISAAVAAFGFVCSEPMWLAAQGQVGDMVVIFLVVLSVWFFLRFLARPAYSTAVETLATLGLLCAESPFGWALLAIFVLFASRYIPAAKADVWMGFLDPIRMQKTKWSITFAFIGVFIFGILFESFAFAQMDGLRAAHITSGELPMAFAKAYADSVMTTFTLPGFCLFAFAVVVPCVLVSMLIRSAADEDRYLSFTCSVVYFLCGTMAFLQLSPYASAWFWNLLRTQVVASSVLPCSMFMCAAVLAIALFVLCVEILCRDYIHIEDMLYQGISDEREDAGVSQPTTGSVRLTFGRLFVLVVPLVLVALIGCGRRLSDDRHLQSLVCDFVNETIEETSGAKYLFTDGAFDSAIRLEARRRGLTLNPISLMSGKSSHDGYVRQLGVQDFEDRVSLEAGAAETLHTWIVSKSERSSDVAVQLGFEHLRQNRHLKPVVYGLLVRPQGGDEEKASASVTRCHALSDKIVAAHESGIWRHAKNPFLKDRLLFAQFRLAVISRFRAIKLDSEGRAQESLREIAYSDRLNACNPSLAKIVRKLDWLRRQNGEDLTPREGLEIAMKRLDFNMARRYAQPILRGNPDEPNANFALGMGFYAEGQYAKAEEYLTRVLKRSPNEPAVYNNLALICLKTGRLVEAEKNALKALELMPDQAEIKDTLAQVKKAKEGKATPGGGRVHKEPSVCIEPGRVGVCSWSWRKPIAEVAVEMQKAGVKGIHLALGPFIAPDKRHGAAESEETLEFVKGRIAAGEWKLMSTMIGTVGEDYSTLETIRKTGGIVPDENWEENKRIVTAGAKLTKELGCRYMSTHAGFLDEEDPVAFATYVERVRWMRDECAKYDVMLILESGQETAEALSKFMDKIPGVGINFDPANMILYAKGDPMKAVRVLIPWIRQVHIKDACVTKTPGTWGTEVPWGTGEVGGKAFLSRLAELGYKGNFVIERESGDDRAGDIRKAINGLVK